MPTRRGQVSWNYGTKNISSHSETYHTLGSAAGALPVSFHGTL